MPPLPDATRRRCTRTLAALALAGLTAGCAAPPQPPGPPRADHHQHVFSPALSRLLSTPERPLPVVDADAVVALLDAAGIRQAVLLSTAYLQASPGRGLADPDAAVRADNDWTAAQAARHPGRLVAFCGINPLADGAVPELERCAGDPNLQRGVKLHFGNADVQLDRPDHRARLQRVFAAANAHGMAIAVHLRASISRQRPYGAEQAHAFLEQLLPLAPDVTVQVAHFAGSGPGYDDPPAQAAMAVLAQAVERNDPRTRRLLFDVATIVDVDIAPATARRIAELIRQIGPARVLFGSDAAVGATLRPAAAWAAFLRLPLTRSEFDAIARVRAPYLP